MGHSKPPSVSARTVQRIPEPPEVRNWKVNIYCVGVCFGALALGELIIQNEFLYIMFQNKDLLYHAQVTMSLSWVAH